MFLSRNKQYSKGCFLEKNTWIQDLEEKKCTFETFSLLTGMNRCSIHSCIVAYFKEKFGFGLAERLYIVEIRYRYKH